MSVPDVITTVKLVNLNNTMIVILVTLVTIGLEENVSLHVQMDITIMKYQMNVEPVPIVYGVMDLLKMIVSNVEKIDIYMKEDVLLSVQMELGLMKSL